MKHNEGSLLLKMSFHCTKSPLPSSRYNQDTADLTILPHQLKTMHLELSNVANVIGKPDWPINHPLFCIPIRGILSKSSSHLTCLFPSCDLPSPTGRLIEALMGSSGIDHVATITHRSIDTYLNQQVTVENRYAGPEDSVLTIETVTQ